MADGGPPASHLLSQITQPAAPPVKPGPMPQLNWSTFNPEFPGKSDKDVEAHLIRTNDWRDTHEFPEGAKVQDFV